MTGHSVAISTFQTERSVDFLEDPLGRGMFLQQVAEAQQRGGVKNALDGHVDTD